MGASAVRGLRHSSYQCSVAGVLQGEFTPMNLGSVCGPDSYITRLLGFIAKNSYFFSGLVPLMVSILLLYLTNISLEVEVSKYTVWVLLFVTNYKSYGCLGDLSGWQYACCM